MADRLVTRKEMLVKALLAGLTGCAGILGFPQPVYSQTKKQTIGNKANDYFDDGSNRSVGNNATRIGNHVSGLFDDYTGLPVTFTKCDKYVDGTQMTDAYIDGVIFRKKGMEYFKRNFSGNILPEWFGIKNDNSLNKQEHLNAWMHACTVLSLPVFFPAGHYCLPIDFEYDFEANDLSLIGADAATTIITTYDDTPETNFAIPEKIDITKNKPSKGGVYQIDYVGKIHHDFAQLANTELDSYVKIENGIAQNISLTEVKALGYLTELDTNLPDPGIDGLYVVARHEYIEGGGGFAHLSLPYDNRIKFYQGTILKRSNGFWSRHYTAAGFIGIGNMLISNISFENVQFYLFSPLSKKGIPPQADSFKITNCSFRHCARVLAVMSYAGNDHQWNWYRSFDYFPTDGHYRFNTFTIANNDFSYIHTAIMWCGPPVCEYSITNNRVHDCYTIVTCFYIFPPINRSVISYDHFDDKMIINISDNSFVRIRTCNPAADHALHVVRVIGAGNIRDNIFTDITKIAIYVCSRYYKIYNNKISHYICDNAGKYKEYSSVISKFVVKEGEILISGNTIINPLGNMLAVEQCASFRIVKNVFIGYSMRRYITAGTPVISTDRVYSIKNIDRFKKLAGTLDYDRDLAAGDSVYFNKRKNKWVKLLLTSIGTISFFSKISAENGPWQYVAVTDNTIEIDELTCLSAGTKIEFKSIVFERNNISFIRYLHIGNNSVIGQYIFSHNKVFDSQLKSGSLAKNIGVLIENFIISGNTFSMGPESFYDLYASRLLIFSENILLTDRNVSQTELKNDYHINEPIYEYGINLHGDKGTEVIVKNNHFNAVLAKFGMLLISDAEKVSIDGNSFNLNIPLSPEVERDCIFLDTENNNPTVEITNNKIVPENGKKNNVIKFDGKPTSIQSLLTNYNSSSLPALINYSMTGGAKTIQQFYKGKNFYAENIDQVKAVDTIVK